MKNLNFSEKFDKMSKLTRVKIKNSKELAHAKKKKNWLKC